MTMLSTSEAAERLERSETWVQKAIKRGELPATTRPKNWGGGHRIEVSLEAVEQYLARQEEERRGRITAADAAVRAGVLLCTLHKATRRGEIPVVKVRRVGMTGNPYLYLYDPAEIDRWVADKPRREEMVREAQREGARKGSKIASQRPRVPKPTVDDAVTPTPVAAPPRPVRMQEPPTNKRPAPKQFRSATDLQDARRLWEGMRAIWAADKAAWAKDLREIVAWEQAHPETLNRPSGKAVCP